MASKYAAHKGVSLPTKLEAPAVIENPSNSSEILIIGGKQKHDIYIYDKTTKKFSKSPKDDLTKILKDLKIFRIRNVYAFDGMRKDTIIVVGIQLNSGVLSHMHVFTTNYDISFYSIFNTKSFTFESIGDKIFTH